jgi:hypothetical protein
VFSKSKVFLNQLKRDLVRICESSALALMKVAASKVLNVMQMVAIRLIKVKK